MVAQRVSTTADRLKQRMEELGIKQVDIVEACKPYGLADKKDRVGKSHISQWVNGINEPSQNKLTILARVLNVTEAWLLGYDVPKEPIVSTIKDYTVDVSPENPYQPQSDDVRLLIRGLNKLTPEQIAQAKAVFRAMFAITNPDLFEEGDDDNETKL